MQLLDIHPDLGLEHVSRVTWSLVHSGASISKEVHESLERKVGSIVSASPPSIPSAKPQALANLTWSLASSGLWNSSIFDNLQPAIMSRVDEIPSGDLIKIVHAYSIAHKHRASPILEAASASLIARVGGIRPPGLAKVGGLSPPSPAFLSSAISGLRPSLQGAVGFLVTRSLSYLCLAPELLLCTKSQPAMAGWCPSILLANSLMERVLWSAPATRYLFLLLCLWPATLHPSCRLHVLVHAALYQSYQGMTEHDIRITGAACLCQGPARGT